MDRVEALVGFLNRIIDDVITIATASINYMAWRIALAMTQAVAGVIGNVASTAYSIAVFLTSVKGYYASAITTFVTAISTANVLTYTSASAKVKVISAIFSELLDYLNYSTLLIVHRLHFIVDYYYKAKMTDIYQRLAVYSVAIGAGYSFLPNAFSNARTISLIASSSQGRNFDVGEVIWLRRLRTLLMRITYNSQRYAQTPARIYQDIDELITIPAINAKSGLQLAALATIESMGKALAEFSERQSNYTNKLDSFIAELPELILERIKSYISDLEKILNDWITDDYLPKLRDTTAEITLLQSEQNIIREQLRILLDKLSLGGDILYNILNLPEPLKSQQLNKVSYVASRVFDEQATQWIALVERLRG